jgi:hypothetical protein
VIHQYSLAAKPITQKVRREEISPKDHRVIGEFEAGRRLVRVAKWRGGAEEYIWS